MPLTASVLADADAHRNFCCIPDSSRSDLDINRISCADMAHVIVDLFRHEFLHLPEKFVDELVAEYNILRPIDDRQWDDMLTLVARGKSAVSMGDSEQGARIAIGLATELQMADVTCLEVAGERRLFEVTHVANLIYRDLALQGDRKFAEYMRQSYGPRNGTA